MPAPFPGAGMPTGFPPQAGWPQGQPQRFPQGQPQRPPQAQPPRPPQPQLAGQPTPPAGQAPAWGTPNGAPREQEGTFRGAMARQPEPPPPPRPLALPAPEQLGVGTAPPAPKQEPQQLDWNAVRQRLQKLGAVGFNVNRVAEGGYRVTVVLPTGQEDRHEHVAATAADEAGAITTALARAEQWATARR